MSVKIMSIVNFNTGSFFGGSRARSINHALAAIEKHLENGADIIDIGAVSTAPGSSAPVADYEQEQIKLILQAAVRKFPSVVFSVDTYRPRVAETALGLGAQIINDISGGGSEMFLLMAKHPEATYVLMHAGERPHVFSKEPPEYKNGVVSEVRSFFEGKMKDMEKLNISKIYLDPGLGFGKSLSQNYELLASISCFKELKKPVLIGLSRKRMIWAPLGLTPEEALNGTVVANTVAALKGADILRVHDTSEAKQLVKLIGLLPL